MQEIKISLIIPFYNVEQYIAQCLDSVYCQDLPEEEYEVICVDDCSPDGSIDIVRKYQASHSNLILVQYGENRKLGGARNAGMEFARGEYVWFIDSDDFIEPNVLGTLYGIAKDNDLDVLHFDSDRFPVTDDQEGIAAIDTGIVSGPELFFNPSFVWYNDLVTAWRKLYRRSFLKENSISFAENVMFEDNDYAFLIFANAKAAMHTGLVAYHYRVNPASITQTECTVKHISYWTDLCLRLAQIYKDFKENGMDERFEGILEGFIRYQISHAVKMYSILPYQDKTTAKRIIRQRIDASFLPFMSKKLFLKLRIGLL